MQQKIIYRYYCSRVFCVMNITDDLVTKSVLVFFQFRTNNFVVHYLHLKAVLKNAQSHISKVYDCQWFTVEVHFQKSACLHFNFGSKVYKTFTKSFNSNRITDSAIFFENTASEGVHYL